MPSKKAPCPCPSCNGTIRDAKTIKKHMANQAAAQTSKLSYTAQWQDLYMQANQRCKDDDAESDGAGPGLEAAQSGGSAEEGLHRPIKRCHMKEDEMPVVGPIISNEHVFFCSLSYFQYSTK